MSCARIQSNRSGHRTKMAKLTSVTRFLIALSCLLLCEAQTSGWGGSGGTGGGYSGGSGGVGGVGGGGSSSDFGYGYAGVDSRGHHYGGAGGNGGYHASGTDDQGRPYSYGGQGGQPGQPGQPGYGYGYGSSSGRSYNSSADSTATNRWSWVALTVPAVLYACLRRSAHSTF